MAKDKETSVAENQNDHIVLISPAGHKYEISVSDEGNIVTKYVPGDAE